MEYKNMGNKNKQYEERQPNFSKTFALSKDKNWLIFKTIRTDIIHINYFDKVLQGD